MKILRIGSVRSNVGDKAGDCNEPSNNNIAAPLQLASQARIGNKEKQRLAVEMIWA